MTIRLCNSILVSFIILVEIINVFFGVETIYDDGFLLMKSMQNLNSEFTQSIKIVNFITFNNVEILLYKILRILIQVLPIFFVLKLFKSQKTKFFIILLLIPSLEIYSSYISYNHLSSFLTILVVIYFLFKYNKITQNINALLIAPLFFLDVIIIPTSGIVLTFVFLFFIFLKINLREFFVYLIYFSIGLVFSLILYCVFINNFLFEITEMLSAYKNLSASGRGYSPFNMFFHLISSIVNFLYYFGIIFFIIFVVTKVFKNVFFQILVLIALNILIFNVVYKSGIFLLLLPMTYAFYNDSNKSFKNIFFYFSILLLPLLLSLGTNTSILDKSLFYLVVWMVYLYKRFDLEKNSVFNNTFIILMVVNLVFFVYKFTNNTKIRGNFFTSTTYSKLKKINKIGIRPKQKAFFERVDSILKLHNISSSSPCIGFHQNQMTFYILGLNPIGVYFQPTDFILDPKRFSYKTPKTLFLNDYEYGVLLNDSVTKNWNFPSNYKSIPIGSPEDYNEVYSTERVLYIQKNDE